MPPMWASKVAVDPPEKRDHAAGRGCLALTASLRGFPAPELQLGLLCRSDQQRTTRYGCPIVKTWIGG